MLSSIGAYPLGIAYLLAPLISASGIENRGAPTNHTADNSTPLLTTRSFLGAIKTKAVDLMYSLSHENATSILIRNGEPQFTPLSQLLEAVRNANEYIDEIGYNEIEHIDGDFASVWVPYLFFQSTPTTLHHVGSNAFSLWNDLERGWLITALADTSRDIEPPQCK